MRPAVIQASRLNRIGEEYYTIRGRNSGTYTEVVPCQESAGPKGGARYASRTQRQLYPEEVLTVHRSEVRT